VAVVLEAGAWGASSAGPIARHILDAWLTTKGTAAPPFTPYKDTTLGNAPAAPEDLPVDPPDGDTP
jgi:penicillin-binding protein 2